MTNRVYINVSFSGTIALEDFAKIAPLIQPEYSDEYASADTVMPEIAEETYTEKAAREIGDCFDNEPEAADDAVLDAHGWPWSAELHASTKGTTKDGLWRMKVGVTRPAPKPGFPVTTETPFVTSTPSPATLAADIAMEAVGSSLIEEPASADVSQDEDDEFAAFRAAAAKADANDEAAKANVPARSYSDADLGMLCNQAAVKMGDPLPIKDMIAVHVPEGEVVHSRNIPADQRAAFVAAVEAKAGIEFAG